MNELISKKKKEKSPLVLAILSLCFETEREKKVKDHKSTSKKKCVQFSLVRNIGDARLSTCLRFICYNSLNIGKSLHNDAHLTITLRLSCNIFVLCVWVCVKNVFKWFKTWRILLTRMRGGRSKHCHDVYLCIDVLVIFHRFLFRVRILYKHYVGFSDSNFSVCIEIRQLVYASSNV